MREIDEVRIILSRLLSHTAQLPLALIDEMLKASEFVKRHMASIKVNAYGRGLLVRLRDLKQVTIRRTRTILGMYRRHGRDIETHLYMRWDYKAMFARARGDRALRRSRKALGLPGGHEKLLGEWHRGFSYAIWRRWINRKTAVEDHYRHRHRLGVQLLDFGKP
jgi:hypothetical protein